LRSPPRSNSPNSTPTTLHIPTPTPAPIPARAQINGTPEQQQQRAAGAPAPYPSLTPPLKRSTSTQIYKLLLAFPSHKYHSRRDSHLGPAVVASSRKTDRTAAALALRSGGGLERPGFDPAACSCLRDGWRRPRGGGRAGAGAPRSGGELTRSLRSCSCV